MWWLHCYSNTLYLLDLLGPSLKLSEFFLDLGWLLLQLLVLDVCFMQLNPSQSQVFIDGPRWMVGNAPSLAISFNNALLTYLPK